VASVGYWTPPTVLRRRHLGPRYSPWAFWIKAGFLTGHFFPAFLPDSRFLDRPFFWSLFLFMVGFLQLYPRHWYETTQSPRAVALGGAVVSDPWGARSFGSHLSITPINCPYRPLSVSRANMFSRVRLGVSTPSFPPSVVGHSNPLQIEAHLRSHRIRSSGPGGALPSGHFGLFGLPIRHRPPASYSDISRV